MEESGHVIAYVVIWDHEIEAAVGSGCLPAWNAMAYGYGCWLSSVFVRPVTTYAASLGRHDECFAEDTGQNW